MYHLNTIELSSLHQESIRQQAAEARLLRCCSIPRLNLAERTLPALGELLIRTGQRLKEAPRRLEAETASLASLTITL